MSPLSGTSVPREMVAIVCTFVFSLHWLRRLALAEPRVPSKATSPKGVCLGSNPVVYQLPPRNETVVDGINDRSTIEISGFHAKNNLALSAFALDQR
jgi:hypothetical protein